MEMVLINLQNCCIFGHCFVIEVILGQKCICHRGMHPNHFSSVWVSLVAIFVISTSNLEHNLYRPIAFIT